ncbi:hypothetical protein TNCV_1861611 [Trichonephila clavipes]|nr:hypothetical protein TNCV_1861611 [Trichonephila clavipes]
MTSESLSATIWKRKIDCLAVERSMHELGNVTHMEFYAFFKVGQRWDVIMVDHGLEVSQQPKVANIHVGAAVGSLVVRASDSRPEGLGSMPDATKYLSSTHDGVRDR